MAEISYPSGAVIFVNENEPRGKALLKASGNYNPKSAEIWNHLLALHTWANVVDVGVNYGEMLVLGNLPKSAKVYGFEPNPLVLPWLKQTIAKLSFEVTLIEAAVSDQPRDSVTFEINNAWSGMSKLQTETRAENPNLPGSDSPSFQNITVPCYSIDSALGRKLRDGFAMKVDVEGYEPAVLRGATRTMRSAKNWAVMFEVMHMRTLDLAKIGLRHRIYFLDSNAHKLVPMPRFNLWKLRAMRKSPSLYHQDAVLLSNRKLAELAK